MSINFQSTWDTIFPWLLPPAALGLFILGKYGKRDFGRLAGFLTLKPFLVTPIWFVLVDWYRVNVGGCAPDPIYLVTVLPSLTITVLLVRIYRQLLQSQRDTEAFALFGLDAARWINSAVLYGFCHSIGWLPVYMGVFGLVFPTIYGLLALSFCHYRRD